MDRPAFLESFRHNLEEMEKFQGFIDKAKSQQGKFAASIVEKVIKDNTAKVMALAEAIMPLTADVDTEIAAINVERETFAESRAAEEFEIQVLELRLAIEEIDAAGFETASATGRASIAEYDSLLEAIDAELGQFNDIATRWAKVGEASGVLEPVVAKPKKSAAGGASPRR